jgi:predicted nucleotidyltransferase
MEQENVVQELDSRVTVAVLRELVTWGQEQQEVLALYLYGSHVEGRATALSDIDVAVLAHWELPRQQLWQLEKRCMIRWPEALDIRVLNLAPLTFRYEVTVQGRRLWAADLGKVADWESLTWREYWDLRPRLEQDWAHYVVSVMERKSETERQQYQAALAKVRTVHRRVRETASSHAGDL